MYAATSNQNAYIVTILFATGADIKDIGARDKDGTTVLMLATAK